MRTHLRCNILRATTAAILLGLTASSAFAAAPMAKTSAPGYYRFMLGNFEVTALSDGTVDLPVDQLLHEPAAKTVAALDHAFQKTPQETSDNAYLINTGERLILIDTGAGDLFGPTLGKLMGNLKASGYTAAEVDDILLTHDTKQPVQAIISVGGFLGIGSKLVQVDYDRLKLEANNKVVMPNATKDELKNMKSFSFNTLDHNGTTNASSASASGPMGTNHTATGAGMGSPTVGSTGATTTPNAR